MLESGHDACDTYEQSSDGEWHWEQVGTRERLTECVVSVIVGGGVVGFGVIVAVGPIGRVVDGAVSQAVA